jgi:hypothetical protein
MAVALELLFSHMAGAPVLDSRISKLGNMFLGWKECPVIVN